MKEELLIKIREESRKEISTMEEYNQYANRRNQLAEIEEIKAVLGLPHNDNLYLPTKTEASIIMSTYKKYAKLIEEKDTNDIYVYISTYMPSEYSYEEIEEGAPLEIEVDIDNPRATHRYYWNLEGLHSERVNIEDIETFEMTHQVIYVDDYEKLQTEFIIMAVKESQEIAVNKILKKYKTQSK